MAAGGAAGAWSRLVPWCTTTRTQTRYIRDDGYDQDDGTDGELIAPSILITEGPGMTGPFCFRRT